MIEGWPAALTIAGSDSWGGAGLEADLRAFAAFGVWGTVAVTAVTAQNHRGVLAASLVEPGLVERQIDAVAETGAVRAVKTGMLGDARVIRAVAAALDRHHLGPLVVDPVQAASQGGRLLDPAALPVLVEQLLPRCTVVTPNLPEAEALLDARIAGREEMAAAAVALGRLGAPAVLLKGGHLAGPDAPDVLWHEGQLTWLEGDRVPAAHSHGTGCTLSAAVAAGLARGETLPDACRAAKHYVCRALEALVKRN
ncbi:MAG TPA: bifunctional hydroxymethylpyrimidine kinase/phosphomethylpyrimidine kinase [Acidimicrobiales bacterium]|nr:bifunctional hydroxymethylpyrimidine kinase/phosphomethylpyrimidine kinase [Acidimicrobiales bacterium]